MIAKEVRAWAAGIIDGEGYIGKRTRTVRVDNTDMKILQNLAKYFGGNIFLNRRSNRPNSKPCWYWRLYGDNCIRFLKEISPYVISKKDRISAIQQLRRTEL